MSRIVRETIVYQQGIDGDIKCKEDDHDWSSMQIIDYQNAPPKTGYKYRSWTQEFCRKCGAARKRVWDHDGYQGGIPTVQL